MLCCNFACCKDFGDGGAYPEIHAAQFPMGMGQQKSKSGTSNALAKQVDADGKIKYDVIARYGHAQDKVYCFGHLMLNWPGGIQFKLAQPK